MSLIGKFRSKSVIEALLDLLTDNDKNVCAVAAISLARTGASGPRVSCVFQNNAVLPIDIS